MRIPPPPPGKQQRARGDGRYVLWFGMFVIGLGVGLAFYRWLPAVTDLFDGWMTPLLRN